MSLKKKTKLSEKKSETDLKVTNDNSLSNNENSSVENENIVDRSKNVDTNDKLHFSLKEKVEQKRLQALKVRKEKNEERLTKKRAQDESNTLSKVSKNQINIVEDDLAQFTDDLCEECHKNFPDSYLLSHFDKVVCDSCRDSEEAHRLITRTEAKEEYLLKDCDFDSRSPPLKFLSRKNKQKKFGEMKLYLECQVADRASDVWGSEEGLEAERTRRVQEREKMKKKKVVKKMSDLRRGTRPGLFISPPDKHQHEYDKEVYNKDEDVYTNVCTTCGHKITYEKM